MGTPSTECSMSPTPICPLASAGPPVRICGGGAPSIQTAHDFDIEREGGGAGEREGGEGEKGLITCETL